MLIRALRDKGYHRVLFEKRGDKWFARIIEKGRLIGSGETKRAAAKELENLLHHIYRRNGME